MNMSLTLPIPTYTWTYLPIVDTIQYIYINTPWVSCLWGYRFNSAFFLLVHDIEKSLNVLLKRMLLDQIPSRYNTYSANSNKIIKEVRSNVGNSLQASLIFQLVFSHEKRIKQVDRNFHTNLLALDRFRWPEGCVGDHIWGRTTWLFYATCIDHDAMMSITPFSFPTYL